MPLSDNKEEDLYNSFVKFVAKLENTFHTKEDAISQRNAIQRWTEFVTLLDLFSVKLRISGKEIPNGVFLIPLLIELGLQCLGIDAHQFNETYLELERCMNEPSDDPRVWCYLYPLECSIDVIDFDGLLRIRRATILERAFYRQNKPSTGESPSIVAETKPGIIDSMVKELHDDSTKFEYRLRLADDPLHGDCFFTLVSILRLLKPNPIGYDALMFYEKRGDFEYHATYQVSPWKHPCTLGVIRDLYLTLGDKDIEELMDLWEYYHLAISSQDAKSLARLKRAIRRYELVITSNEIEDAIVDSVIALETIFSLGGKEMAESASKILGANKKSSKLIYQILYRAHRMRNIIVHGGALEKSDEGVNRYLLSILGRILVCAIVLSKEGDCFANIVKEAMKDKARLYKIRKPISKWLIK